LKKFATVEVVARSKKNACDSTLIRSASAPDEKRCLLRRTAIEVRGGGGIHARAALETSTDSWSMVLRQQFT